MNDKLNRAIELFKRRTLKNAYSFELQDDPPSITDTKLGGVPYREENETEYFLDKQGLIMPLLVQINFKDVMLENYPNKGILQIFTDKKLSYPADFKVKYYENVNEDVDENIIEQCENVFDTIDVSNYVVKQSYKLKLQKTETYMPLNDYRFQKIFSEIFNSIYDSDIENIYDIDDLVHESNAFEVVMQRLNIQPGLIGGYADFVQDDPREFENSDYTECLFKLDNNIDFRRVKIGDSGILSVMISENDLVNRKFENSILEWDCC